MRCRLRFDGYTGYLKTFSWGTQPISKPWRSSGTKLWMRLWIALLAAFLLLTPAKVRAQHSGGYTDGANAGSNSGHGIGGPHDQNSPEPNPRLQEQLVDRRNSERQKQLMADTEKLFQLAQQLRDEVAKSNKDQLSIPVVKRSEEIEKLARSVKEKMRGY